MIGSQKDIPQIVSGQIAFGADPRGGLKYLPCCMKIIILSLLETPIDQSPCPCLWIEEYDQEGKEDNTSRDETISRSKHRDFIAYRPTIIKLKQDQRENLLKPILKSF